MSSVLPVGSGAKPCRQFSQWDLGRSPAANTFSAYSRPENASRRKKKNHFQLSSAARTTDPTIILLLSSSTEGSCPECSPLSTPVRCEAEMFDTGRKHRVFSV